jgi:intracellular multiplication protein IcmO
MFNPFASGDADVIRDVLMSQLGGREDRSDAVFRARAVALMDLVAPALTWMRDARGITIDSEKVRFALELQWIAAFVEKQICLIRDPGTKIVSEISAGTVPPDIIRPLRAYLGKLPGFDLRLPYDEQRSDMTRHLHHYAVMFYTPSLAPRSSQGGVP